MAGSEKENQRRANPKASASVSQGHESLNIVCVLKTGGDYDEDYVRKLSRACTRNLGRFFRFICLNDVYDKPVFDTSNCIQWEPLEHNWPGWWSKVEMFKPSLERYGRILYMDLDTVITGDITELASYSGEACIVSDWNWGCPSQSILNFTPGSMRKIWDAFNEDPETWMRRGDLCKAPNPGDQILMNEVYGPEIDRFQDLYPGQIVSYKKHCKTAAGLPGGVRIVCFHGKPRPRNVQDDWVLKHWN